MRCHSYCTWAVDGPNGPVYIRRNGRRYLVGKGTLIPGFFTFDFKLKREARVFAEGWAGTSLLRNAVRREPQSVVSMEASP